MKVLLLAEAEQELHEAINWYDDQQAGLGSEFEHEVFTVIERIQRNSLLGSFGKMCLTSSPVSD